MRKITLDICAAFMQGASRSIGNSTTDGKTLFLHGNAIAWHGTYQDKPGVFMTLSGWATPTTKERLGGVLDAMGQRVYVSKDLGSLNFYQRKGLQFIGENTRPHKEAIELDASDVVFVVARTHAQGIAAVYPPAHLGQSQLCKDAYDKMGA